MTPNNIINNNNTNHRPTRIELTASRPISEDMQHLVLPWMGYRLRTPDAVSLPFLAVSLRHTGILEDVAVFPECRKRRLKETRVEG